MKKFSRVYLPFAICHTPSPRTKLESMLRPFHLAIPVRSVAQSREWYARVFGCAEGRHAAEWVDLNLYGHQLVLHEAPEEAFRPAPTNHVDGEHVPVPHFGVVLERAQWAALRERVSALDDVEFLIRPQTRFKGLAGEQSTMFFLDPDRNALEFKAFDDLDSLFRK